jgi:hypothetical protein
MTPTSIPRVSSSAMAGLAPRAPSRSRTSLRSHRNPAVRTRGRSADDAYANDHGTLVVLNLREPPHSRNGGRKTVHPKRRPVDRVKPIGVPLSAGVRGGLRHESQAIADLTWMTSRNVTFRDRRHVPGPGTLSVVQTQSVSGTFIAMRQRGARAVPSRLVATTALDRADSSSGRVDVRRRWDEARAG